jgi:hypothetical protein
MAATPAFVDLYLCGWRFRSRELWFIRADWWREDRYFGNRK